MPSSTSSSSRAFGFPLRVAAATAAIVLAYNLLIALAKPDAVLNFDAGIRNQAVAERYLDGPNVRAVLTGSSMAYRLSVDFMEGDYLGPNVFNLSLAGKTALPGLDLALAKPDRPRLVFVEMNTMDRGYDPGFAAEVVREPLHSLRALAPGLRIANRPVDLAIVFAWRAVKAALGRAGVEATERVYTPVGNIANDGPPVDAAFRRVVENNVQLMTQRVEELRTAGVRVVLLRLPSDPIAETARTSYMWDQCAGHFAPDRYEWLDLRATGTYQTEDGIHLNKSGARKAAAVLRRFVEQGSLN